MNSQSQTKRNIFRSSLRREFIQSHQRQIRKKYFEYEQSLKMQPDYHRNSNDAIKQLENILNLDAENISHIDNFQYFIRCLEDLQIIRDSKCKVERMSDGTWMQEQLQCDRYNGSNNKNTTNNYQNIDNYSYKSNRNSSSQCSSNDQSRMCEQLPETCKKVSKISSIWFYKQKIYSLIYRIVEKCLSDKNSKLWYIIERVVYLLEFPELMPLWQKISTISDLKCKTFLCKQFSRKLSKSWCIQAINNYSIILDAEFVLDILVNFITIQPIIDFQICLQLFPFICYCLNLPSKSIQSYHTFCFNLENEDFPKINKICIILRSILQEDPKDRVNYIVDTGFQGLLGYLIGLAFANQKTKPFYKNKEFSQEDNRNDLRASKRLECGFLLNSKSRATELLGKKPASPQIIAKTNLLKLLNRLLLVHPLITVRIVQKHRETNLMQRLIRQSTDLSCLSYEEGASKRKYLYLILCDSHRTFKKCILTTLCTMFSISAEVQKQYVRQFLTHNGLELLEQLVQAQTDSQNGNDFTRQIANIVGAVETYLCREPNHKIREQWCVKFVQIQVQLANSWAYVYLSIPQNQNLNISHILQIRTLLPKLLKQCRNILLSFYARATQPQIFEACSSLYMYGNMAQILKQLGSESFSSLVTDSQLSQQNQIREYSKQIVQLCKDPVQYMQMYSNGYETRISNRL